MAEERKSLDREAVRSVIQQWNTNRLDLFALSEPDENLLFHGVMRFYFQDSGQKVATKCIRVASDATVSDVIDTLIEKFRPDMRMLSVPNYALYEVHANGEERRLNADEKPLLVQLNWHVDDREGRFLLKNIDQKISLIQNTDFDFKRKLSKREKKELKKKEKLGIKVDFKNDNEKQTTNNNQDQITSKNLAGPQTSNGESRVAGKLYSELPETSFTRSISNPEAVMRRRRQQKLEKKLQQFRSRDGGPDTGGTLKIYGENLCRDVPYKTLLLSIRDCASAVVREMLCKYGLDRMDSLDYCLVQVNSDGTEYILDEDECPLSILMNHPTSRGSIMFHVRRRPADSQPRRRKKKPLSINGVNSATSDRGGPMLIEIMHNGESGRQILLNSDPIEVGSANTNNLQLFGPSIQPRHCIITLVEGVCTVTPLHTDALTFVNGHEVTHRTILHNGSVVMFGRVASYRFVDLPTDGRYNLAFSQTQLDSPCLYDSHSPASPGSWKDEDGALSSTQKSEFDQISSKNLISGDRRLEDYNAMAGNLENETKSISSVKSGGTNYQDRTAQLQNIEDENHGQEPILPAVLEFPETYQELFLQHIIRELDVNPVPFKLAPAYALYLCARYRASTHYRPELQPIERANKLTIFLHHVANLIQTVVQEQCEEAAVLAFWMANSSEFLHFLKSDRHICAFSMQAQEVLAESVQTAFHHLLNCIQTELSQHMNQFLSDALDHETATSSILRILSSVMVLLRRCRVNAALTIQLFSQLFHCINVTCFNKIITNPNMCTAELGAAMSRRLELLELWAERQGLELAADCHLAKINQCAQFLVAPKTSVQEVQQLACSCFRLNSLQMAALLQHADTPRNLVETAIRMAKSVADELAHADGRKVQLEDPLELKNALLLPDDGFSCDVVRGVPPGLVDFLNPLQQKNFCRLAAQPTSIGLWTVYMHDFYNNTTNATSKKLAQPDVQIIKLHKNSNGMGLSIVAAKGAGQERLGIYIKSVVSGGAAELDGRLQAGDQLLRVDGQSLIGITQERAADYLVRTGPVVTLEVAKQGAIYHGLATLLQQPSPEVNNDHQRLSDINLSSLDHDAKNSVMSGHPAIYKTQFINSKSVPALSHHAGKEGKFNSHSKSRSINSLSNNTKNTNHENGFYQNLSVYSAQHPNHQEVERTQSSQHIFTPILGTNTMQHHQPQQQLQQQQQQQQPHQHHQQSHQQHIQSHHSPLMPVVGSDLMQINRPAHTLSETNITMNTSLQADNLNKTLPHLHDNVRQAQHQVDGSYGNMYENNKKQAAVGYPSPLDVNNSRFTNNHTPNLRMQQMLAPSMPDISSLQNQQSQQQAAKMPTNSILYQGGNFESYHGVAKSMQNMNTVGYPPMSTDYLSQHAMDLTQKYTQSQLNMYRQQQENSVNIEAQLNHQPQHQQQLQQQNHLKRQMLHQQSHLNLEKPPLPPTATHPLFKSQQLSSSVNYVASNLDPPKGGFLPTMLTMAQRKSMSGTNPWEREEREKEVEIRRTHVRKWREQQIDELSSIAQRTPHQEEHLKTLILERDFDRRVQELEEQGDDNDVEQKDAYNAISSMQLGLTSSGAQTSEIKMANICDNYKSFPKSAPELPKSSDDYVKKIEPTITSGITAPNAASQPKGILKNNRYDVTPASPSKAPKTTSFAEDCILHTEHNNFKLVADLTQTYDSKNANNPDIVSITENNNKYEQVEPPPPPERNSSFLLMSRQNQRVERVTDNVNKPNFTDALALQQKKLQTLLNNNDSKHVSFQDVDNKMKSIATQPLEYGAEFAIALSKSKPTATLSEYDISYDNNSSLYEADDSNSSSIRLSDDPVLWNTTVQSTPGVIGAQEVYRDPRQRRLAEKEQEQQQRNNEAVPEKLSFKEKMKMFALETGENQSPREKLKISKAQRDIDEVQ